MIEAEIQRLRDRYNFVWATRRILYEDAPVTYMLRRNPNNKLPSSGWLFLSHEDEKGIACEEDIELCSIERIIVHSPGIIPFLRLPVGSSLAVDTEGVFAVVQKGRYWWQFWRASSNNENA